MIQPSYQVFSNEDELKQYVIENDPMKKFTPIKREIGWNSEERNCDECGDKFMTNHPAQHFCESCQSKVDKKNKRESVIDRMKKNPTVANCEVCEKPFYKIAPAMLYCINCSPKGGSLVNTEEETSKTN